MIHAEPVRPLYEKIKRPRVHKYELFMSFYIQQVKNFELVRTEYELNGFCRG